MALLDPKLYSENVLIVGDGNFSFSICLASALSNTKVKITATSLDSRAALENNDFAVENIEKLSAFGNVEVLHEVDATDLSRTFGCRTFDRVIFNFPHVGGKSNIGKSRQLLEWFFVSAAKHVEPHKGQVCVSLCQGQGGTPLDNPRRELGNTWQVVYRAAKADLILNAVYPFRSADYIHYRSAGFRGQLCKGFHTVNGLTHVFVHGLPVETVPDVSLINNSHNNILGKHYPLEGLPVVSSNPIHIVTNKLKSFFLSMKVGDKNVFSQFKDINSLPVLRQTEEGRSDTEVPLSLKALHNVQENGDSFVLCGTEINFFLPPSSYNHPISHKMVAVHTFVDDVTDSEVRADLQSVIDAFTKDICSKFDGLRKEISCSRVPSTHSPTDQDLMGLQTVELKCGTQRKFKNITSAASAGIGCECGKQTVEEKCIFCRLEGKYLRDNNTQQVSTNTLFKPKTQTKLYHKDELLLSCGVLNDENVCTETSQECCTGWLMEINLDFLTMALFGIPDIRLLWSDDGRFKEQFAGQQGNGFQDLKDFVPFSLFPPTYIHDISFWITEHMTEQRFFQDIYETTQGCVQDVKFIERYHDTEQDKVSYNYCMVYSSCDRPLTHIQTVKMQNLLRRKLLNCDVPLK